MRMPTFFPLTGFGGSNIASSLLTKSLGTFSTLLEVFSKHFHLLLYFVIYFFFLSVFPRLLNPVCFRDPFYLFLLSLISFFTLFSKPSSLDIAYFTLYLSFCSSLSLFAWLSFWLIPLLPFLFLFCYIIAYSASWSVLYSVSLHQLINWLINLSIFECMYF